MDGSMAERVGFEPTVRKAYTGFRDQHIRPLCHLSAGDCLYPIQCGSQQVGDTETPNLVSLSQNQNIFQILSFWSIPRV